MNCYITVQFQPLRYSVRFHPYALKGMGIPAHTFKLRLRAIATIEMGIIRNSHFVDRRWQYSPVKF